VKKAHLLRYAAYLIAQRISIYASRFGVCGALQLNFFDQPVNTSRNNNLHDKR